MFTGAQAAYIDEGDLTSTEDEQCGVTTAVERTVASNGKWATVEIYADVAIAEWRTDQDLWEVDIYVRWIAWPNGPLGGDLQPGESPGDREEDKPYEDVAGEYQSWDERLHPATWGASSFVFDGEYEAEVSVELVHKSKDWDGSSWSTHCDEAASTTLVIDWTNPSEGSDTEDAKVGIWVP